MLEAHNLPSSSILKSDGLVVSEKDRQAFETPQKPSFPSFRDLPKKEDLPKTPSFAIKSVEEVSPIIRKGSATRLLKRRMSIIPNYRKIYQEEIGPIPEGYEVHHLDKNPGNNGIENLIAIPKELHTSIHQHESALKRVSDKEKFTKEYLKMMSGAISERSETNIRKSVLACKNLPELKNCMAYYRKRQIELKKAREESERILQTSTKREREEYEKDITDNEPVIKKARAEEIVKRNPNKQTPTNTPLKSKNRADLLAKHSHQKNEQDLILVI